MRDWDLADREERRRVYGYLLRDGPPLWIYRWVDGALLVDLWPDLDLPDPVRDAWQPLFDAARQGPTEDPMSVSLDDNRKRRAEEVQERRAARRAAAMARQA